MRTPLMELSPEQAERLRRLLEDELRAAARAAADDGVPAAVLAEELAGRHRALRALAAELADDPHHPADQGVPGDGVAEQR
ncbi:hypothetical protein BJY16_008529 [Actinoplanes octamycinicus]|uniref:Uncharacterized protein n=1 Tax=Actinoplanes octamycinicus TaxID=135948 RepID=A0A7W7H6T4_9ACTN|nr:hypothetical protein [Actinoplanes octamycinicus]MBB4745070.1 hypothetical protein [Actinoplanes octamycinicus]